MIFNKPSYTFISNNATPLPPPSPEAEINERGLFVIQKILAFAKQEGFSLDELSFVVENARYINLAEI